MSILTKILNWRANAGTIPAVDWQRGYDYGMKHLLAGSSSLDELTLLSECPFIDADAGVYRGIRDACAYFTEKYGTSRIESPTVDSSSGQDAGLTKSTKFFYPTVAVNGRTISAAGCIVGIGGSEPKHACSETKQDQLYGEILAERLALAWNATRDLSNATLLELAAALPSLDAGPTNSNLPQK